MDPDKIKIESPRGSRITRRNGAVEICIDPGHLLEPPWPVPMRVILLTYQKKKKTGRHRWRGSDKEPVSTASIIFDAFSRSSWEAHA